MLKDVNEKRFFRESLYSSYGVKNFIQQVRTYVCVYIYVCYKVFVSECLCESVVREGELAPPKWGENNAFWNRNNKSSS